MKDDDQQGQQPEPLLLPDLSELATEKDVSTKSFKTKSGGQFHASYINWAHTMSLLRQGAPGWLPIADAGPDGIVHRAPNGSGYLMIRFRHVDGRETVAVPHAIVNESNDPVAGNLIDSRDISDAFVRGMCKAAALVFGLAWKMWSKDDPMTSDAGERERQARPAAATRTKQEPRQEPAKRVNLQDIIEVFAKAQTMEELHRAGQLAAGLPETHKPAAKRAYATRAEKLTEAQTRQRITDEIIAVLADGSDQLAADLAQELSDYLGSIGTNVASEADVRSMSTEHLTQAEEWLHEHRQGGGGE
jgi:hypothetical protein